MIAETEDELRNQAKRYGYHLGMAFQLIDDALDYEGQAEELGKNIGDDLAEGKATLPLIHAMLHGNQETKELVRNAIINADAGKISQILAVVSTSGGLEYTRKKASVHAEQAKNTLRDWPDSSYKKALLDLADFAVNRAF